jgi:trigger factor
MGTKIMHSQMEILEGLARRLTLGLPVREIEREVEARLRKLARTARMPGFRPGKAPLNLIARQHGTQVRQEVVADALRQGFGEAIQSQDIRIAGTPNFTPRKESKGLETMEFDARFEVYPDIAIGELGGAVVQRPQVQLTDDDVEQTLQVLRKQRVQYHTVDRPAQAGDRVTLNYEGKLNGEAFPGGKADGFILVLGDGRMLPEFEMAVTGLRAHEEKDFDLRFPDGYPGKELAGQTTLFHVAVTEVAEPHMPELDADFAKSLGVENGDLGKLREEVKANLEREVRRRQTAQLKEAAFKALVEATPFELPQAAVEMGAAQIAEQTARELTARGIPVAEFPMNREAMLAQAERRVRLGMLLAEVVKVNKLKIDEGAVRAKIEDVSQSYEDPAEVVAWYYQDAGRRRDIESMVLEDQALEWVLSKVTVVDTPMTMHELMGNAK